MSRVSRLEFSPRSHGKQAAVCSRKREFFELCLGVTRSHQTAPGSGTDAPNELGVKAFLLYVVVVWWTWPDSGVFYLFCKGKCVS